MRRDSTDQQISDVNLVIGDIGGTNARFAVADTAAPGFSDVVILNCADYSSADMAIRDYIKTVGAAEPEFICLAVAGPIVNQRVRFTNNHWSISEDGFADEFPSSRVKLLNDFEAISYSIPCLSKSDFISVGLPESGLPADGDYTIGIIGPGTGLGAVGLTRRGDRVFPIVGEASHCGFAPETQVQVDVLNVLRERFDRVSAERLVSGAGIENIFWALTQIHGQARSQLLATEIFAAASDKGDPRASEAVHLFLEILGQVAGDLALTLGATDGVFIAGGIVPRYPGLLEVSGFRNGFDNKGRHRSIMESIPTQLIMHPQPGLHGASAYALEMVRDSVTRKR